jgi:hydroxyacylglutathione hydrolase
MLWRSFKNNKFAYNKKFSFSFLKKPSSNDFNDSKINKNYDISNHSLKQYLYLFKFNQDNIGYILHEPITKQLIGVDFGEYEVSSVIVKKIEKFTNSTLRMILTTHSHNDHCGGNKKWKENRGNSVQIYSGFNKDDPVPFSDKHFKDLETISIGDFCIACMYTPGHKKSHVCYVITHLNDTSTKVPFLFSGDLLFIGGCGKVLDGTYEELYDSLKKISYLPNDTLVFCGHEYTLKNLEFIEKFDPDNPIVIEKKEWANKMINENQFTVGSRLIEEKLYNPFLRSGDKFYQDLLNEKNPFICFKKLRILKDNFK